jgi:GDP-L-fucose synthase
LEAEGRLRGGKKQRLRYLGFKGEIRHDLSKPDGAPRKLLDVSKVKQLGWEPKIGLKEGIRKVYDNYLCIRKG